MSALQLPGLTPGTWEVDPAHSEVGFSVRHMMVSKVRGRFTSVSGLIKIAEDALASSVTAEVQMESIDTGQAGRDEHLRTNDFFDVPHHPTMTFASSEVRQKGEDFVLVGDLTIKGNTRPVEFALEFNGALTDPYGKSRAGFSASTSISRKAFGVDIDLPMDGGGVVIGDKVDVSLDIEAVKQES